MNDQGLVHACSATWTVVKMPERAALGTPQLQEPPAMLHDAQSVGAMGKSRSRRSATLRSSPSHTSAPWPADLLGPLCCLPCRSLATGALSFRV